MKISQSQLRKLIQEQMKRIHEMGTPIANGTSLLEMAQLIVEFETKFPGAVESSLAWENAPTEIDELLSFLSDFYIQGKELHYEGPSDVGDFLVWNGSSWVDPEADDFSDENDRGFGA